MTVVLADLNELTRLIPANPKLVFRMKVIPRYGDRKFAVAENVAAKVTYFATTDGSESQIHGIWMLTQRSHIIVRADSYGDCREELIRRVTIKINELTRSLSSI